MSLAVWVFCGDKGRFPSGVFSSKEAAAEWIKTNQLTGTLTEYPVDTGVYDWAIRNGSFVPKNEDQKSPRYIQNFSSGSLDHYHFEDGATS